MDPSSCPGPGEGAEPAGCVRVRVEGSVFSVERALLWRGSGYFRALFRSGMRESRRDELSLGGCVRARAFLLALAACRGERPEVGGEPALLWEAAECAAFLQAGALARLLADLLDSDNCLLLLHAAATFGLAALQRAAAEHARDAFRDLRAEAEAAGLPEGLRRYAEALPAASYVALGTHSPSVEELRDRFRTVSRLDEARGEWRHLADLPAEASTSMAGVAALGDRLYVVGGVRGVTRETVDRSFSFDPRTGGWSQFAGPSQPRYNFTLLAHEGRLYAVGGEYERKVMSSVEACDVEAGEWSFVRHAPRPVAGAASAVCRRRMFVCFWKPPDTTDIYEYHEARDEWAHVTALVRPQSYGHCMVAHRDSLYVMRNGPSDDFLRCLIDRYCLATGQWATLPGAYVNSKGALFTAAVRGDSVFCVNRKLTLEYAVGGDRWRPCREMAGFPKSGSLWTCLLRLPADEPPPQTGEPPPQTGEPPAQPVSSRHTGQDRPEDHQPS